jgi:superfamily II DNA or RNA helicase
MIIQETPTKIRLIDLPEAALRQHLTYIDKSVDFELAKARNSRWLMDKLGEEAWREHLAELKAKRVQSLLFEDDQGFWTFSGLGWWLASKFNVELINRVQYPEGKNVPWARVPEKTPRSYQQDMKTKLLEVNHGGVEVGTGLGKSFVIMLLAKELGLKTTVMTPSVSIAEQIYNEFEHHLGKKYVGQFFAGKKDSKKLFVIAVDDSLSKVEKGSPHWKELSKTQVFIADESHLCPAKTLAKVCTGLLASAPYRWFFSGTQLRNDGLDLLLDAITGKIVYRMSVEDGVNQGYLAKPMFRTVPFRSTCNFESRDANEMTRAHLYYEPTVNAKAGEIANLMVEELGRQVVILIKEVEQLSWLLPHLRHEVRFAHGGVTADQYYPGQDHLPVEKRRVKVKGNRKKVPEQYWDSDPNELVRRFNAGEFPILVGTSCITTGTDIQSVGAILTLQGGKSEIQVRQSVGRGTRKIDGKTDCYFIDFDPVNVDVVHRHAQARVEIYQGIYPDYEELKL